MALMWAVNEWGGDESNGDKKQGYLKKELE